MYRSVRQGQGTVRQVRYQGLGNHVSDPHDLISMHQKNQEAASFAQRRHIVTLIEDTIKDEIEAEKEYKYLLGELTKYQQSTPNVSKVVDLISHIRNQEIQHKAILEQLVLRISR